MKITLSYDEDEDRYEAYQENGDFIASDVDASVLLEKIIDNVWALNPYNDEED